MNALNLLAAAATVSLSLLSGGDSHAGGVDPHAAPAAKKGAPAATEHSTDDDHGSDVAKKPSQAMERPNERSSERTTEKGAAKPSVKPSAKANVPESVAIWNELMEGNRRFVEGHLKERELLKDRAEIAQGESPSAMVLSCADSRVSPETVFDQGLGEFYAVRIAGNVADPSVVGSLEYGCETLHVRVLVILGHERCSAVASAAGGEWVPSPNMFEITKRITPALANVPTSRDATEMSLRQVRANVEQSYADLVKQSPLLAKAVAEGELTVVRAVYRLKTGEIERIDGAKPMPSIASTKEDASH